MRELYMDYDDLVQLWREDHNDPDGINPNEIDAHDYVTDKYSERIDRAMDYADMER